jgi:uncharacterized membrane protein YfcA
MLIAVVLGALVGIVLGLTGAGGGILAVPALVFGLGWSVTQSTPVALLAVSGAALVGTVEGLRKGLVRYKAALVMSGIGVLTTPLGVSTAHRLPEATLLILFGLTMFVVAGRMLWQSRAGASLGNGEEKVPCKLNPDTGRLRWTPKAAATLSGIGVLSGFLTGLLGVGGGFVIVPALRMVSDISIHGIVATSLMVIALVGGGAVISAWLHGAALPLAVAAPFLIGAMTGMLAGRMIAHRLPARLLQGGFAVVLCIVAVSMIVRAL